MQDLILLAADQNPKGPEFGKAQPIGLLILLLLLISMFALVWGMNRRLRRLPESFDPEHPEADQREDDGTDAAGVVSPASAPAADGAGDAAGSGDAVRSVEDESTADGESTAGRG